MDHKDVSHHKYTRPLCLHRGTPFGKTDLQGVTNIRVNQTSRANQGLSDQNDEAFVVDPGHLTALPNYPNIAVYALNLPWQETNLTEIFEKLRGEVDERYLAILSASGVENDQWVNGWLAYLNPDGRILAAIPPGYVARLCVQNPYSCSKGVDIPDFSPVPCLLEAFRNIFGDNKEPRLLSITDFSLEEGICTLLLAQAFPKETFHLHNPESPKMDWPNRWKRYAQFLAMPIVGVQEASSYHPLSVEYGRKFLPPSHHKLFQRLVNDLNSPTRILDVLLRRS